MINVYIVDYYNLKANGLSTYREELVQQLISNDNNIRINYVWVKCEEYNNFEKTIDKQNLCHYHLPKNIGLPNGPANYDNTVIQFLKKELEGVENIIFHFNWINHAPFAYLLKQHINCKILLTKHCIPWRDFITKDYHTFIRLNNQLKNKEPTPYLQPALIREKINYEAMDQIICVTDFANKAIQKMLHIPAEKISVVHNGLDFSIIKVNKTALRRKYGFASKERIILFAGKVHQSKGVNDLALAFNRLFLKSKDKMSQPVHLVIAGAGNHNELLKNIDHSFSAITITGALDKNKLYDFYQMADIGVVPSYIEQCSYTCIEMIHHNLPIIVANVDGLAEIVPDGCGLKVPLVLGKNKAYIHHQKLTDGILCFLNNPKTAKEYAARARQHALMNFTARKMVAETVKVYEMLITKANTTEQELRHTHNGPLVSILLPAYNEEKYLKACIDSILKQTYSNFELIIVTDGSADSTIKITKRYRDNRIILLNIDQHQSESDCLNQGIKTAKGKYIAHIDADSVMHRKRLQKQVAFLEDEKNKGIALVGCQHYIVSDGGKLVNLKQYPVTDAEIKATMLFRNPFSRTDILVRSAILKKYKYTKKYEHAKEYQLLLKLLEHNKGANINAFLSYKCQLVTSEQQRKMLNESRASLLTDQFKKWNIDYSIEELKIHIAINCGYGRRFFNNPEKIAGLKSWVLKLLTFQKMKFRYSDTFIKKMQRHIMEHYCDVY